MKPHHEAVVRQLLYYIYPSKDLGKAAAATLSPTFPMFCGRVLEVFADYDNSGWVVAICPQNACPYNITLHKTQCKKNKQTHTHTAKNSHHWVLVRTGVCRLQLNWCVQFPSPKGLKWRQARSKHSTAAITRIVVSWWMKTKLTTSHIDIKTWANECSQLTTKLKTRVCVWCLRAESMYTLLQVQNLLRVRFFFFWTTEWGASALKRTTSLLFSDPIESMNDSTLKQAIYSSLCCPALSWCVCACVCTCACALKSIQTYHAAQLDTQIPSLLGMYWYDTNQVMILHLISSLFWTKEQNRFFNTLTDFMNGCNIKTHIFLTNKKKMCPVLDISWQQMFEESMHAIKMLVLYWK